MALRKNAQIFTLVAIAIVILTFVSFSVYSIIQDRESINTRVGTMDSFLFSIEHDLERQMYIVGFRGLFLAEVNITQSGNYLNNVSEFFEKVFFESSPYDSVCNESIYSTNMMCGARYVDLIDSINQKAEKMHLSFNISHPTINIYQENPWEVKLSFEFNLTLEDKTGLANWNKRKNINTSISIEGFEDPVFALNTGAKVSRKINRTIYEGSYKIGSDISGFRSHVNERYYANNSEAPSFLKRFEGDFTPDENGIETFVFLPDLSAQGISTKDKSCVDYIYFSTSDPASTTIAGMPSWFKIDNSHQPRYGV